MGIQSKLVLWLLSLAAVALVLFGAYRYGKHVEGLERDRQQLAKVEQSIDDGNALAKADNAAATDAAADASARTESAGRRAGRVEQGITARPEYTACALSPQDLAELNAAVEGR